MAVNDFLPPEFQMQQQMLPRQQYPNQMQQQMVPRQQYPIQPWMPRNPFPRMRQMRPLGSAAAMAAFGGPPMGPVRWRGGNHFSRNGQKPYGPLRNRNENARNLNLKRRTRHNEVEYSLSNEEDSSAGQQSEVIAKEIKGKSTPQCISTRPWNKQDAERALLVELEAHKKQSNTLMIRFPDPEISVDMIKSFHEKIEKIHFQLPIQPRHCYVKLAEDSDLDAVMNDLNRIEFYKLGKIKAERKIMKPEENTTPEMIDPYTLYVGNLPDTITAKLVKDRFPTAVKVDVGFSHRLKFTRYAFIRYQTVEESIEAFQSSHNTMFQSRTLIVRFRRKKTGLEQTSKSENKKFGKIEMKKFEEREKLKDLQKFYEKKIKKEKKEKDDEGAKVNVKLRDVFGEPNIFQDDDQISEDDEKEVDDEDKEDDVYEHEQQMEGCEELDDEEEDVEDDEDEDEEDEDDGSETNLE